MATYTVEIRSLMNEYGIEIFDFDYPFYTTDKKVKEEFEELFINRYYFHEIGAETIERWKQMLKARLMLKMPYYEQLYQTEWTRVGKDMMTPKDLTETTTRKLESTDASNGSASSQASSSGRADGSGEESNINDGVSVVNLKEGNRTGMNKTSSTSSGSSNQSSTTKSSSSSDLEETITFHSYGDIGIQTPAYAITEWRKVIINLNEMLINELDDLFMKIY